MRYFGEATHMPTDVHYSIGVMMKLREAHASNTQKNITTHTARHMDARTRYDDIGKVD